MQFSDSCYFSLIFIFHIDIVYECIVLRCIVENKLTYLLSAFVDYNSACRPILPQSGLRGGRDVRALGVGTLNANSVQKNQSINAKSEPSKCSGLAISGRRPIYAMIGVEFQPQG